MGISIAILGALAIGVANVLMKKNFATFSPSASFFVFALMSFVLWGGVGIIGGFHLGNIWYGLLVGFSTAILGQGIYFHALSKGELTITVPILASYSVYTVIFSLIFNHEHLSLATALMVALAIIGTLIISFPEKIDKKELDKLSPIIWAIVAAVAIGASDTLSKHYINNTSVWNFFVYAAFAQVVTSFGYMKLQHESLRQFGKVLKALANYQFLLSGTVATSVGTLLLFLAFQFTQASIASPITSTYPVVTVVLAYFFLKEKISKRNWLGVVLVVLAILGLGFFAV